MRSDIFSRSLDAARQCVRASWIAPLVRTRLPSALRLLRANVLLAGALFVTSVILARFLAPGPRGILANAILWPTFLSQIALCGVPLYLSREMAARPDRAASFYQQGYTALRLTSAGAMLLYFALLALPAISIMTGTSFQSAAIASLIIPFSAWNALQVQMELGRKSMGTYTFARASFTIAYLVLVVGLALAGEREAPAYLWAFVGAAAVAAVATHIVVAGALGRARALGDARATATTAAAQTLPGLFRAAAPFGVSSWLISVASSADRLAVSLFFDVTTLGIYVVALALSQVQSVVNEAVAPLFFTSMAQQGHLAQTDAGWLAMRLRQSVLINVATCGALMVSAPVLLPLIYGQAYASALAMVLILLPAMGVRSTMRPFEEVLKGINRPLSQSLAIGTTTGVFFAGAAVAAWFGSVIGLALALLASACAGLISVALLVARERNLGLAQMLIPRPQDIAALTIEVRRTLGR